MSQWASLQEQFFSYVAMWILRSVLPPNVRRVLTLGRDQFGDSRLVICWRSSVLDRSAQDPRHDFDAELAP